jgi:hypothetical protein
LIFVCDGVPECGGELAVAEVVGAGVVDHDDSPVAGSPDVGAWLELSNRPEAVGFQPVFGSAEWTEVV